MSVNIDNVYRTVLAISNKEQRGYIGPAEFNLFANQAQREIFETYFFDDAHFSISRKGMAATGTSDIKKNIQEKIDVFSRVANTVATTDEAYDAETDVSYSGGVFTLPTNLYRLGAVYYADTVGTTVTNRHVVMIPHEGIHYVLNSKLTAPTQTFPKFTRSDNTITVYPNQGTDIINDDISVHYVTTPREPIWSHLPITGTRRRPVYDPGNSTDFDLHNSEQYLLVEKILIYAGIQLKQADIVQFAAQDEAGDNQNKKS